MTDTDPRVEAAARASLDVSLTRDGYDTQSDASWREFWDSPASALPRAEMTAALAAADALTPISDLTGLDGWDSIVRLVHAEYSAAHDLEVAARALREAAEKAGRDYLGPGRLITPDDLRARADHIEAGDNAGRLSNTEPPTEVVP